MITHKDLMFKLQTVMYNANHRLEMLKRINEDENIQACPFCKIIWVDKRNPREHRNDCELAEEVGIAEV